MAGPLANPKHELYAKHRANQFIPKKAAVAAGYATGSAIYTELESDPDIQQRINELMDERNARKEAMRVAAQEAGKVAGELSGVSQGWVMTQLRNISDQALDAGDFKEAKEAAVKIGEHLGMFGKPGEGGTGREGNGDGQMMIDLDTVAALTRQTDHLQPQLAAPIETDPDVIAALIEGQGTDIGAILAGTAATSRKSIPKRTLSTGSETDVAMRSEDDPDDV